MRQAPAASGAYVYDIAKVHEAPIDPTGFDLTGKYLAEVPKHRASFQVSYTNPRLFNVAIDNQFVGHQFDDDRNEAVILPNVSGKTEIGLPAYMIVLSCKTSRLQDMVAGYRLYSQRRNAPPGDATISW